RRRSGSPRAAASGAPDRWPDDAPEVVADVQAGVGRLETRATGPEGRDVVGVWVVGRSGLGGEDVGEGHRLQLAGLDQRDDVVVHLGHRGEVGVPDDDVPARRYWVAFCRIWSWLISVESPSDPFHQVITE